MKRSLRWAVMLGALIALVVGLTACGGSSSNSSSTNGSKAGEPTKVDLSAGKKGGKITFLAAADIDYADPGQTYYTFGFMVQQAINRPLYSFKPDDTTTPVPDLAAGPPEISADNKTITVKIRQGVKYAPPVNREVTTADVKYAFERSFSKNVPSGYAGTYFSSIEGTPAKPNTGDIKPISGITTPDKYTIVFKLKAPQAPLVSQALVMPITVPVPEEYAKPFDAKLPSTYDQYVAQTGPYMIQNDSKGKLVGRKPGKQITMVRNPNWDGKATGDYRPAYLDGVTIEEGNDQLEVASRRTLSGNGLMCCDAGSPPAQVLKSALTSNKDQIAFVPSGGTRYIALNTKVKPFDNLNVRKAVVAGFDKNALRQTRGGKLLGDIATGWLPPGIPGFEEAGGLTQGKQYDFDTKPTGDLALAKQYFAKAKAEGVPIGSNGLYNGPDKLLTIATNADPGKKTAEVAQNQFTKLGFKLQFRIVPQDTLYTKFCGVPSQKVAICPNVGWFKDFTDPQSMLDATFNGNNILQQGNVNWPQLDVPAINDAMKAAATTPVGTERNKAWAKINDMIIGQAPAIPWIWDKTALIASKDVKQVPNGYTTVQDLSFSSLK
ncbi:MAG: peptide/nickel transport system substrate-binding protein [Solirubrobacteraceae bacterium]|nr:peptide/nickel transport system substrate-binding protein [Solirubrobacteraceae bacterium]